MSCLPMSREAVFMNLTLVKNIRCYSPVNDDGYFNAERKFCFLTIARERMFFWPFSLMQELHFNSNFSLNIFCEAAG